MKKLLSILFLLPLLAQAQTVVYDIPVGDLIGLYDGCSSGSSEHLYNYDPSTGVQDDYGISWNSTGSGTPTSVTVELWQGVSCGTGSDNIALNGTNQGTLTNKNDCNCTPTPETSGVISMDPADYNTGGYNESIITWSTSTGLSQNAAWGNAYARVTVLYGNTSVWSDNIAPVANNTSLADLTDECSVTATAPTATDTYNYTYDIFGGGLVGLYDLCGNGNLYNNNNGALVDYGISWASMSSDAVAEITVELWQGIGCGSPTENISLNGTVQGTITNTGQCTCTPTPVSSGTITMDPADYAAGATNQVIISAADWAGLSPNGAWNGAYARVTVTYVSPTAITATTTDPVSYTGDGSYTITWTYDDGNGNTSSQTQNVIIDDVTAPVADVTTLADVTDECGVTLTAPTATDNCLGSISATTTDPTTYVGDGSYVVTWTYDDGMGNTSSQTQNVIILNLTDLTVAATSTTVTSNETDATATYQWVDCAGGGSTVIAGETSAMYTPPAGPGYYAVQITRAGCTVTSNCTAFGGAVGVEEASNDLVVSVSPNPNNGNFTITVNGLNNNTQFRIFDLTGKIVKDFGELKGDSKLKVSDLNAGVYILQMYTATTNRTHKIIVLD